MCPAHFMTLLQVQQSCLLFALWMNAAPLVFFGIRGKILPSLRKTVFCLPKPCVITAFDARFTYLKKVRTVLVCKNTIIHGLMP